jgi:hypothetical protein
MSLLKMLQLCFGQRRAQSVFVTRRSKNAQLYVGFAQAPKEFSQFFDFV